VADSAWRTRARSAGRRPRRTLPRTGTGFPPRSSAVGCRHGRSAGTHWASRRVPSPHCASWPR
jgi:hypothetical protein